MPLQPHGLRICAYFCIRCLSGLDIEDAEEKIGGRLLPGAEGAPWGGWQESPVFQNIVKHRDWRRLGRMLYDRKTKEKRGFPCEVSKRTQGRGILFLCSKSCPRQPNPRAFRYRTNRRLAPHSTCRCSTQRVYGPRSGEPWLASLRAVDGLCLKVSLGASS